MYTVQYYTLTICQYLYYKECYKNVQKMSYLNALYCLYTIPSSSKRKHNGVTANSNCVMSAAIFSLPPSDKLRVKQAYRTKSCSSWEARIFSLTVQRYKETITYKILNSKFKISRFNGLFHFFTRRGNRQTSQGGVDHQNFKGVLHKNLNFPGGIFNFQHRRSPVGKIFN